MNEAQSAETPYGRYITSVGTRGSEPSQMNTPHSIQVDARGIQARLFAKLPPSRLFEVLVRLDEAAGQGPSAHERLRCSLDGQNAQPVTYQREKNEVDGHSERRVGTLGLPGHVVILSTNRHLDDKPKKMLSSS